MYAVTIVICLGIISNSKANLLSPLSDVEQLSLMTIANDSEPEIFVAGENRIYKLPANLSQLINVDASLNTSVSVRGLSVSNGGQYIVACLSIGSCIGYDVIDFTRTTSSVPLNDPRLDRIVSNDPIAMFPGNAEGFVYTGIALDERMSLGRYRISNRSIMADTRRDYTTGSFTGRDFRAGFNVDNLTYYIVQDAGPSAIRILRVCNESTFRALYEVILVCGQTAIFTAASLLENFPTSTENTLVLTVRSPDSVTVQSGRVCRYSISDINTAMDNGLTACIGGQVQRAVWDTRNLPSFFDIPTFCSSFTVSQDYTMYLFYVVFRCAI